jgi:queuine tRNA-ribosyltransferase
MFDCVMPTRNARNGTLFTSNGIINIKNKKWKTDNSFIDENINCNSSHYHTKSYLHHLFLSNEILGLQIASLHNLSFYSWLIKSSRYHILRGNFLDWKNDILKLIMNKV